MNIFKILLEFIGKIIGVKVTNSLPRKQDGSLAEDKILIIYVVVDDTDSPIYVVAVTTDGIKTEPATKALLGLLVSYKKEVIYLSLAHFVSYFYHANNIEEIKKQIRYKI